MYVRVDLDKMYLSQRLYGHEETKLQRVTTRPLEEKLLESEKLCKISSTLHSWS